MLDEMPVPMFPVYGLTESYSGARWMDVWKRLWSPDGPLWMVALGHGSPHRPQHVGVITDAKLGPYAKDDGFIGRPDWTTSGAWRAWR